MGTGPVPPPASCPIGWQPQALAPVFWGVRSLGPDDGAPVPLRIFFPSLDGSVETAPILAGCGRYPLVVLAHGHCIGDPENHRSWFVVPAMLARSGYVVVVPHLAGITSGTSPSTSAHPDLATLDAVVAWARTGWEHRAVLLPPPATGVIGHSFGAMLGARFAVDHPVAAYAGLSGTWQDWFGDAPFPLPLLTVPSLLTWGSAGDSFTRLSDAQWAATARPRHRVVLEGAMHWDYLGTHAPPCARTPTCPGVGSAVADLLVMFFARYLPPELATNLAFEVPATLEPPDRLDLTPEQEFFAGGFLGGWAALQASGGECGRVTATHESLRLLGNRRTRETHSLDHPCGWVGLIAARNRIPLGARPAGFHWCDHCFPSLADG